MRLLWIGRTDEGIVGGEYVFDRKTVAACRAVGHEIETCEPQPAVGRAGEVLRLMTGRGAYYRARFFSSATRRRIEAMAAGRDAVICSWEPYDMFALDLDVPTVVIPHNITSLALPAMYPGSLPVSLLARQAARYERGAYCARRIDAMTLLSRRDVAAVAALPHAPPLTWTPPGMPPAEPLDAGATLRRELVLSGTYCWKPKRRDVLRFLAELAADGADLPVIAPEPLPLEAGALGVRLIEGEAAAIDWSAHLRIGIIPDRFSAGHKLKTLQYIADNCVVLSFADVAYDFDDLPDAGLFIRRVDTIVEARAAVEELAAMPAGELHARFAAFKEACARRYTWSQVAEGVIAAARQAIDAFPTRAALRR